MELLPPFWLIRAAVAGVWLYEGLWCKLLRSDPHQVRVAEAVPLLGGRNAWLILKVLGVAEVALAAWVVIGIAPVPCAITQTVLLVTLNASGMIWAREILYDSYEMVVKNFAFLVLAWVAASLPGWN